MKNNNSSIRGKPLAEINAALLDTMTDLSRKLELNKLLSSVLERAVSLLEVTGGELAIYHEEVGQLEVVASYNLGMSSVGVKLGHGEGAMGRVAETLEPLIISDYQTWKERSGKYTDTTVRSVMVVPLIAANKLVGAFAGVHLDEQRLFDQTDLDLLNMFAPLAATAIDNARLFEAEKRKAEEQRALLDTLTDLAKKLELSQLLSSVLERAVSLLKVTGGELAIYDEEENQLEVVASYNLGMSSGGIKLKHGEGAMGWVAKTQEPLIITDYRTWEGRSDKYTQTTVRSVIVVPLIVGNKLVGAFAGVHLEEQRLFDKTDLDLLNMFAPLAATAIENARLFAAEKRKAEEQKALVDTMTDLSRKLELSQLLSAVLERAVLLLSVTGGELSIYHEETKELEVVASFNLGVNSRGVRLKHGEGAMGRVAETCEPLIIPDYQTWEGRSDKYKKTIVRGVIVVPLILGNQLVGALGAVHLEEDRRFNSKDLRLLNMFAPLAATAIDNARLFDKTSRLLQEAEERTAELKKTQNQLVQQEKLASLGELTAGIAHEIQNPLNFVNNFSDINKELAEELETELNAGNTEGAKAIAVDIKKNAAKILAHGMRADSIVKNMLQHSRKSVGEKEPILFNNLVDEYLRLSYHGLRAKDKSFNAALETDLDPAITEISIVAQDIGRVLLNIFNNAFYSVMQKQKKEPGYSAEVSVSTKKLNDKVEVVIRDNGNGIPKKIIDKIWQPFFTTKPTGEGTGLGLSLSYDIITKGHNGEMYINTQENEFAEFRIILPINKH